MLSKGVSDLLLAVEGLGVKTINRLIGHLGLFPEVEMNMSSSD